MKKPQITSVQLMFMAIGSALVLPYTFLPILNSPPANQDVWIVIIATIAFISLLGIPALFLINKFRGLTIAETTQTILGKFVGKIFLIAYALFFIFFIIDSMLLTSIFINTFILPLSPSWVILLFMAVPVSYAAYKGAGTIGRLAVFIVPFTIFTIILFLLLGLGKMDFSVIKPVLADSKLLDIGKGAFFTGARYTEILLIFVFAVFLPKKSSVTKTYVSAVLIFGLCFMSILLPTIMVLGLDLAQHAWNAYFLYTTQIEAYDFIQNVQSLNALAWFPNAILKIALYNYMASHVLSGVTKAKSHKYFVIPISLIGFTICLLPIVNKSSTNQFIRSDSFFPFVVVPFVFVLPLIMLIVYLIRRKNLKPIIDQKQKSP